MLTFVMSCHAGQTHGMCKLGSDMDRRAPEMDSVGMAMTGRGTEKVGRTVDGHRPRSHGFIYLRKLSEPLS
jgi:hypothetical protein